MSASPRHIGGERARLLGHNLVRLLYLDEAGIDYKARYLCVAGILVHGDAEWPEIDRRILGLIEKHVPQEDRLGFFFHAKDIYHGSGFFDRRKPEWADEQKRFAVLCDLAGIIDDMALPIVWGQYEKYKFGLNIVEPSPPARMKHQMMHSSAVTDCLSRADFWLSKFAPDELATVVHEDGPEPKKMVKYFVRIIRDDGLMDAWGYSAEIRQELRLPLKRIIDTVHFAEKADARPLQLADLCAFSMSRLLRNKPIPEFVRHVMAKHMGWVGTMYDRDPASSPSSSKDEK